MKTNRLWPAPLRTLVALGCLTLALVAPRPAAAADNDSKTGKALRALVEKSLRAYDDEDEAAFMATIHTKSPEYEQTKTSLPTQFSTENATSTLDGFDYMGHDDEFAVARIKIKTTSKEPDFADNVIDTLSVFKQEDGKWKYWSDALLGVSVVEK